MRSDKGFSTIWRVKSKKGEWEIETTIFFVVGRGGQGRNNGDE